jgi:hypothetical protein
MMTNQKDGAVISLVLAVIVVSLCNYYTDGVLAQIIQPVMDPLISAVFTW